MSGTRDIGVALSGGGHRATVFGLGVLLALVDQGLNERVVSISSVSGGSIANGIAMIGPDFGTVRPAEFEAHIAGPLSAISDRGILLGGAPATRSYIRMLIASVVVVAISSLVLVVAAVAHYWVVAAVAFVVSVAVACVFWWLFRARSWHTQRAIDVELLGNKQSTLGSLRSRPTSVHHVLCTTELQTGTSFYFSNRMIYGYAFSGTTAPSALPLATAVQASACVPGAFSPCTLSLADIGLSGADRIVLVDGGVYDNMADEWEYGFRGRTKAWPALADAQCGPASLLLVGNASGGWNDLKVINGKGMRVELAGVLRSKDVQYDVSTSHRRRALAAVFRDSDSRTADGVFAQITASPYEITGQFGNRRDGRVDDRCRRADEARCFLDGQGYDPDGWAAVVRRTSGVPTTLAPLGREMTAILLEHGYVLAMVNMYVMYGLGQLRPIDRTRFTRLASGVSA
jgi:hypothetical protein